MKRLILSALTAALVIVPATAASATGNVPKKVVTTWCTTDGRLVHAEFTKEGDNGSLVPGHTWIDKKGSCEPPKDGAPGKDGQNGKDGVSITGPEGPAGKDGRDGFDAICLDGVIVPTPQGGSSDSGDESAESGEGDSESDAPGCLRGEDGRPGADGRDGIDGRDGVGTVGPAGQDGQAANEAELRALITELNNRLFILEHEAPETVIIEKTVDGEEVQIRGVQDGELPKTGSNTPYLVALGGILLLAGIATRMAFARS